MNVHCAFVRVFRGKAGKVLAVCVARTDYCPTRQRAHGAPIPD